MRPSVGGDALPSARPRSRKSSADYNATHNLPSSHVPTAFFLRSEGDFEARSREDTFGVQSLADTLEAAFGHESNPGIKRTPSAASMTSSAKETQNSTSHSSSRVWSRQSEGGHSTPTKHRRKASPHIFSTSPTSIPLDVSLSRPASVIPGTPRSHSVRSLNLSDEESGSDGPANPSISGEEDEGVAQQDSFRTFPQLVMPRIQMPARRPFTTKGKAMGKLKILIVGESGQSDFLFT